MPLKPDIFAFSQTAHVTTHDPAEHQKLTLE